MKIWCFGVAICVLLIGGPAMAQNSPLMDKITAKVIGDYRSMSCAQLAAKKQQPPSPQAQQVVGFLKNNPAARTEFINRVAGAIANKMFDCGLIP